MDFEELYQIINNNKVILDSEKELLDNFFLTGENPSDAAYIIGKVCGFKAGYDVEYNKSYEKGYQKGVDKGRQDKAACEAEAQRQWAYQQEQEAQRQREREQEAEAQRQRDEWARQSREWRQDYERRNGNEYWHLY